MMLPLAVPLALLLCAQPAPAAKSAPSSLSKLEQGQKAFAEGQLVEALKALDAAAAENPDAATMEKVQLLRGQCLAAKGDFGRAEEAFALALEANPEAALDPGRVDPAVVKLLESMRTRSVGSLVVRSTPPGARVMVDGTDSGVTPLTLSAGIGRHKLEARWENGTAAPLEVMVRAKRETYVDFAVHERVVEVEKIVEVRVEPKKDPNPKPPPPPPEKVFHPFFIARAGLDVNAGPETGIDVGGGTEVTKYLQVSVLFRPYRFFYVMPRVAGVYPIVERVNLFAAVEADIRATSRFGFAMGLNAGAEVLPLPFFALFAEVGVKYFFINNAFVVDARFWAGGGVRVRLP